MSTVTPIPSGIEGQVTIGKHGPVSVSVQLIPQRDLAYYYHLNPCEGEAGARVQYEGHKDDLVVAGCVSAETLKQICYDKFQDAGTGVVLCVTSKAGPNRKGRIEVSYYVSQFARLAPSLPGVLGLFPSGVPSEDVERPEPYAEVELPNLRTALGRRYPLVKVSACALRTYPDGSQGSTVCFHGPWKTLVAYGLTAEKDVDGCDEFETRRLSHKAKDDGDGSYVFHHSYDSEPELPSNRRFPTKKVQVEVDRIWRRISRIGRG